MSTMLSSENYQPIWGRTHLPPPPRPLPRHAELVILGGGITGISLARWLQRAGCSAVVVESRWLGAGATGRNAGFLLEGVVDNYARMVARYGRTVAQEIWDFTAVNHRLFVELIHPDAAHYRRRGSSTIAMDAAEERALQESHDLLREDGIDHVHLVEPPAVPNASLALLNSNDGEIDPVAALADMAVDLLVYEGTEIFGIHHHPEGGVTLQLSQGEMTADRCVIALNGYTETVLTVSPIHSVRAQMLASTPLERRMIDQPTYGEWGYRYWRQREDGRLLIGGCRNRAFADEVGTSDTPTTMIQRYLDDELRQLAPTATVTHRWAGTMGYTDDGLPHVGPIPGSQSLFLCGGYNGHGMGLAVHCTRLLARHLLHGDPIPHWLVSTRFPSAS